MRAILLPCAVALAFVASGASQTPDEAVKTGPADRVIWTEKTPLKLKDEAAGEFVVGFPLLYVIRYGDEQVFVSTRTGHSGWVEKRKVAALRDAMGLFDERVKNDPTNADAYYRRGIVRCEWYDHKGAIKDFDEAIRRDAKDPEYYVARALAYANLNDRDKGLADLNAAISLDPKNAYARALRGNAQLSARNFKEAAADFTAAVEALPSYSLARYARASVWQSLGEPDKAISDYSELIRRSPKADGFYLGRGVARTVTKDFEGASADFAKALELNPKSDAAQQCRATLFYRQKNYAEARKTYEAAIRLNPTNVMALNNCAWLLATCPDDKLRNGARAVELSKSACGLTGWKVPEVLGSHAAACAEVGHFDEAVKWQEKAIVLAEETKKADFRANLDLYKAHKPKRE
jgi:serine/threonine-protein kinase